MNDLPVYISVLFVLATALTVFFFYRAAHSSRTPILLILGWMIIVAVLSLKEFFLVTDTVPPRFLLAVGPPLIFVATLFASRKGRRFIQQLDPKMLTILHIVRVPVEITLYYLFINKLVPEVMTFEGRNLDILSGLTAPLIYFLVFNKQWLGRKALIVWNVACLLLLFNVVIHAVLAAPTVMQQIEFDQPNIGVMYFPFAWLPACIVPLVLLSHLASLYQLVFGSYKVTDSKQFSEKNSKAGFTEMMKEPIQL
jgi:hypothetical protein